jgi:hypothetical protein
MRETLRQHLLESRARVILYLQSVAADPSSAVFLLKCSVAQQGIVTASKMGSKNRLFQQTHLCGHLKRGIQGPQNQSLATRVDEGFLGSLGPAKESPSCPHRQTLADFPVPIRTTSSNPVAGRLFGSAAERVQKLRYTKTGRTRTRSGCNHKSGRGNRTMLNRGRVVVSIDSSQLGSERLCWVDSRGRQFRAGFSTELTITGSE